MEIKKLFGSESVFFGVAALLFLSFLSNIYIFLTDKSMLKTGDGWAIMFWAISFASALILGIMDKRGSLCIANCDHDSIKFKRLDSLAKIVVLLLCMSFIYYVYDLVKGGLETKSLTPFTSSLIPIGLLSLILLSLAHVIEKNTRRD